VPLGREGDAEECGDVVAFLCSPLARYITGAVVPIDGVAWAASGWYRSEGGVCGAITRPRHLTWSYAERSCFYACCIC
jgi:hypothetical protein